MVAPCMQRLTRIASATKYARLSRLSGICLVVGTLACGDNGVPTIEIADAAPALGQGSEPTADLIITEVAPQGDGPDWIELRNRGASSLNLCDYFVTDSVDRLDHYLALGGASPPDPCEERLLEAGAFLIIYADDDPQAGVDHAPFRLGVADEVHIVDQSGRAIDSIVYLFGDPPASLSRVPTDTGLFFAAPPSPGAPNPEDLP